MPPPKAADLKRKQVKFMRSRIHVRRRFTVEYLGGLRLRYTCRTCGRASVKDYSQEATSRGISPEALRRLACYQDQGGGASDECQHCTRQERDRQHPLPPRE